MKLVVGLGNPGIEYQFTPHNLGFLAIDRIAEQYGAEVSNRRCRALTGRARIGPEDVVLAKPETYMNLSGLAIRELVSELELDPARDLVVIYDELDLPWGIIRIRERGGTAGHNGIESVVNALQSQEFLRIRLGVGPDFKPPDGAKYVLSQLKKSHFEMIDQELDAAAEAVKVIFSEGPTAAMNRFNRKVSGAADEEE
jgi:peptidyl-tRNA hydrolase, PTH1 family